MVCSPTVYHFLLSCRLRAFSSPHTSSYVLRNIFINNKRRTTAKQGEGTKTDFVTFGMSIGHRWGCKRCPFALQNMPFYTSEDALLHCKRVSFTMQKSMCCFPHYHFFLHFLSSPPNIQVLPCTSKGHYIIRYMPPRSTSFRAIALWNLS